MITPSQIINARVAAVTDDQLDLFAEDEEGESLTRSEAEQRAREIARQRIDRGARR